MVAAERLGATTQEEWRIQMMVPPFLIWRVVLQIEFGESNKKQVTRCFIAQVGLRSSVQNCDSVEWLWNFPKVQMHHMSYDMSEEHNNICKHV